MPELPDLEIYCRNLNARLAGREVVAVRVGRTRRRNFSDMRIAQTLQGNTLDSVQRSGKQSFFLFRGGPTLAIHLMLTGRFDLTDNPALIRSLRLGLEFSGGEWLTVSDPKNWATFTLDPPVNPVPDALDPTFDLNYLRERLRDQKERYIKEFLVDQRLVGGIGNAYSDEILWACRIAPRSQCDRLPEEKIEQLHATIRSVLEDGIAQIERIEPGAIHGEQRDFLKIHRPDRTHSPTGHSIRCERIGSRKTYWTEEQVEYLSAEPKPENMDVRN